MLSKIDRSDHPLEYVKPPVAVRMKADNVPAANAPNKPTGTSRPINDGGLLAVTNPSTIR